MNYLARLANGEGAMRPTRTRSREWEDVEELDEFQPDTRSRLQRIADRWELRTSDWQPAGSRSKPENLAEHCQKAASRLYRHPERRIYPRYDSREPYLPPIECAVCGVASAWPISTGYLTVRWSDIDFVAHTCGWDCMETLYEQHGRTA